MKFKKLVTQISTGNMLHLRMEISSAVHWKTQLSMDRSLRAELQYATQVYGELCDLLDS